MTACLAAGGSSLDPPRAEAAAAFELCLRIPGWALGRPVPSDLYRVTDPAAALVTLKVNGQTFDAVPRADGYVHLQRSWQAGDLVQLDLPMPIRRIEAHRDVKADQGKVALMRGPLVYCLEAVDHPGADLTRLVLPKTAELRAEPRADLLGGVTVLTGQALADGTREIPLTAVPYYAWANRDKGAMNVWIQQAAKP